MEAAVIAAATHGLMLESLEAVAATGQDIVPLFFTRLFADHPADEAHFHNPASSRGNMVNEILGMLLALAAEEDWVEMFMRAQLRTHDVYCDIPLGRYRQVLDLTVDVLAETVGPAWREEWEACWRTQADRLYATIERWH